ELAELPVTMRSEVFGQPCRARLVAAVSRPASIRRLCPTLIREHVFNFVRFTNVKTMGIRVQSTCDQLVVIEDVLRSSAGVRVDQERHLTAVPHQEFGEAECALVVATGPQGDTARLK